MKQSSKSKKPAKKKLAKKLTNNKTLNKALSNQKITKDEILDIYTKALEQLAPNDIRLVTVSLKQYEELESIRDDLSPTVKTLDEVVSFLIKEYKKKQVKPPSLEEVNGLFWMVEWEESERGWGTRPDGTSFTTTRAKADDLIKDNNKQNLELYGETAPDEYTRPCSGMPVLVKLPKKLEDTLKSSKTGVVHLNPQSYSLIRKDIVQINIQHKG